MLRQLLQIAFDLDQVFESDLLSQFHVVVFDASVVRVEFLHAVYAILFQKLGRQLFDCLVYDRQVLLEEGGQVVGAELEWVPIARGLVGRWIRRRTARFLGIDHAMKEKTWLVQISLAGHFEELKTLRYGQRVQGRAIRIVDQRID